MPNLAFIFLFNAVLASRMLRFGSLLAKSAASMMSISITGVPKGTANKALQRKYWFVLIVIGQVLPPWVMSPVSSLKIILVSIGFCSGTGSTLSLRQYSKDLSYLVW